MAKRSDRIAVLIDSDNVSSTHLSRVLDELATYGTTSVRRMYGDWTSDQLRGWKDAVNEHSVQPIQQFAYTSGKNATDSALIIDAMDLLHQNTLDAFAIVSSDSDFTRLAARLRESGARVFGFGERKTPKSFVNACDTFIYFDALEVDEGEAPSAASPSESTAQSPAKTVPKRATSAALRADTRLVNLLRTSVTASLSDEGWAALSGVGTILKQRSPDFDSRNWGYAKLGDLIQAIELFETRRSKKNGPTQLEVRPISKKRTSSVQAKTQAQAQPQSKAKASGATKSASAKAGASKASAGKTGTSKQAAKGTPKSKM